MTQKERMLAGLPYQAMDAQLTDERMRAQELCFRLNQISPSFRAERAELLKGLLGSIGGEFLIESPFRCDYGYNIEVGKNFFSNYNCTILDIAKVKIGNDVMLAPNVSIYTAGHPIHPEPRIALWEYGIPITIGNNVWVGGNSVITPGVTIGDNVVIGAGSVVTKDIPPNTVAVGNPCRVIRQITEEDRKYYFKDRIIGFAPYL